MKRPYTLDVLKTLVAPIAKKHGVARVAVFGSYGRNQATQNSDVDLFIDDGGSMRSLLQLIAFQQDVSDALRVHVDIVTKDVMDPQLLARIQPDTVMLYEQ